MANISKIKLPNNDTAYDIKDTVSGYTTNTGTVTSVRVQATSPVQSSVSTAQSASLNTTISLANGYGDTKNPYASKTKNYVLAAPSTANGVPTFRALTAADIPDLSSIYLTSYTETDPTVPSWAKASTKPSYTASEVGALPSTTVIPSKTSDLTNDSGFITSYTDELWKVTGMPTSSTTTYQLAALPLDTQNPTTGYSSRGEFNVRTDGSSESVLYIGQSYRGKINLGYMTSGHSVLYTTLTSSHTTNRTITLPDKDGTVALLSDIPTVSYPVTSVNSKTGAVSLTASDVGAATSGHTHTLSMATSSGTSSITLAASTKYQLIAGGSTYVFTTPPNTTYSAMTTTEIDTAIAAAT